ncbi:MAG: VCBS repeat-containing protein [Phycisphaerales bacterium]|nr:VCBS repeat-containing protein [Phycisphaerales bacterium]
MRGRVGERVAVLVVVAGLPMAAVAKGDPLEQPWAVSQPFTSLRAAGTAWQASGVQDRGLLGQGGAAAARDINGDGVGDAIFGADGVDVDGRSLAGEVYVIFGEADGLPALRSMSQLDGSNGFTFRGAAARDRLGRATGSGDFNGDGLSDVVIGAPYVDTGSYGAGETYVVFGRNDGYPASLGPSDLDGSNGFRIPGVAAGERSGSAAGGVGDLNGDGVDDLMVSRRDLVYVVFGSESGFDPVFDLSTLDGDNGFRFVGAGTPVSAAGDVNGDGLADAIVGGTGMAFVLFGRRDGFAPVVSTSELDGGNGFAIDGTSFDFTAGETVSSAGDLNGDGFDDVAVGAPYAGQRGDGTRAQGFAFVVFGASGSFPPVIDLEDLDGSDGFRVEGATEEDEAGRSLTGGGDLNGDGFDDLVVGAPGTGYSYSCCLCGDYNTGEGTAFVIYGRDTGFDAVVPLAALSAGSVIRFEGPQDSQMGSSLSGMTDFNADGRPDFLLGAPDGSAFGFEGPGAGMVIYGRGLLPCAADLDGDGRLTLFDFLAFQNIFDAGDPRADFDGDGRLTLFDFLAFQNAFDSGCP